MRRASIVAVMVLVGCKSYKPPVARDVQCDRTFSAALDETWRATVDTFAGTRVPIATIEKDSGIIVLQRFSVAADQGDFGELGFSEILQERAANGNVLVRTTESGTRVQINLTLSANVRSGNGSNMMPFRYEWRPGVSTGVIERGLLDTIEGKLRQR